ncbi:MAG: CoA transferase subunit A [Turicibacter sp.]|nr:CoA transferase subunit A [Turicibacter sp.]
MNKVVDINKAIELIPDGATIMFGGFMGNGSAHKIIDALVEKNVQEITVICNDAGFPDYGVGKLVSNKQVKKVIASHIGLNKELGRQMSEGITEVELIPQGTLVEQIRSHGYGLGGFLTKTGVGTLVEEGKEKIKVDGITYLLEKPLKADVAILFGALVDRQGNISYKGSENNFNHVMASAAEVTIVEAREVVEIGEMDPNAVVTPGVFVNYVVEGGAS